MLELKNVTKAYNKGSVKAVDSLSMTVNDGEIFGFLGPNGAGKTTSIRMLTGILQPDEGELLLDGISIKERPIAAKRTFAFVPDNPETFSRLKAIEYLDFFYAEHENTLIFNISVGMLLGIAYSLFELPNSFLKRRLGIIPGKTQTGFSKAFFVFLDQADSIFGCALVVWLFYDLGILKYLLYVLVGAATHIVLNMLLYFAGLRKNMF